jgi:hypothetical protein
MPLPLLPGFLPFGSRNLATPCLGRKPKARVATQSLATDIAEVQILRGIILLGGDFNARIVALLDTINTNDLCELL